MAEVACCRCELKKEGMEKPPFRGALGQKIHEKVCKDCWAEWQGLQTRIINEYRLSLGDQSGQELLDQQMRSFLKLSETA